MKPIVFTLGGLGMGDEFSSLLHPVSAIMTIMIVISVTNIFFLIIVFFHFKLHIIMGSVPPIPKAVTVFLPIKCRKRPILASKGVKKLKTQTSGFNRIKDEVLRQSWGQVIIDFFFRE
jgi:hypothetical protein